MVREENVRDKGIQLLLEKPKEGSNCKLKHKPLNILKTQLSIHYHSIGQAWTLYLRHRAKYREGLIKKYEYDRTS